MTKAIKLIYFDGRGRAELTRWILHAGGIAFDDVRVKDDDWPAMKPNMPLGYLPVLEVDGIELSESMAIARFCAQIAGLAGKNEIEQAKANTVVEVTVDTLEKMFGFMWSEESADQARFAKEFLDKFPKFLSLSDKLLCSNGGKYFIGNGLSWADIQVTLGLEFMLDPQQLKSVDGQEKRNEEFAKYPKLQELVQRVKENAGLKQWLSVRHETPY